MGNGRQHLHKETLIVMGKKMMWLINISFCLSIVLWTKTYTLTTYWNWEYLSAT